MVTHHKYIGLVVAQKKLSKKSFQADLGQSVRHVAVLSLPSDPLDSSSRVHECQVRGKVIAGYRKLERVGLQTIM